MIQNRFDHIRKKYGVPAKRGGAVLYNGRMGTITRARASNIFISVAGESFEVSVTDPKIDWYWENRRLGSNHGGKRKAMSETVKHGGKRKGAGRKRANPMMRKHRLTVRVPKYMVDRMDCESSPGEVINRLLAEYYGRMDTPRPRLADREPSKPRLADCRILAAEHGLKIHSEPAGSGYMHEVWSGDARNEKEIKIHGSRKSAAALYRLLKETIGPGPEPPTVDILDIARDVQPSPMAVVGFSEFRARTGLSKEEFDAEVLRLANAEKIWVHVNAYPAGYSEQELADCVYNPDTGNYYVGMVIK